MSSIPHVIQRWIVIPSSQDVDFLCLLEFLVQEFCGNPISGLKGKLAFVNSEFCVFSAMVTGTNIHTDHTEMMYLPHLNEYNQDIRFSLASQWPKVDFLSAMQTESQWIC